MVAIALAAGGIACADDLPPSAEWQVTESVTPLTGAASVTAVLPSSNTLTNYIGAADRAELVLRCQDGVLATYVTWPEVLLISGNSLAGDYQTMVLWKIDAGQIAANFWDRSSTGTAAGKFTTGGAVKVIGKLIPAHQLVVRMSGQMTQDAVFDLGDVGGIAARIARPCGVTWSAAK